MSENEYRFDAPTDTPVRTRLPGQKFVVILSWAIVALACGKKEPPTALEVLTGSRQAIEKVATFQVEATAELQFEDWRST
jgi:hypothetical protein